jgi:hypothetical protein
LPLHQKRSRKYQPSLESSAHARRHVASPSLGFLSRDAWLPMLGSGAILRILLSSVGQFGLRYHHGSSRLNPTKHGIRRWHPPRSFVIRLRGMVTRARVWLSFCNAHYPPKASEVTNIVDGIGETRARYDRYAEQTEPYRVRTARLPVDPERRVPIPPSGRWCRRSVRGSKALPAVRAKLRRHEH